jgi:hypothetical protein
VRRVAARDIYGRLPKKVQVKHLDPAAQPANQLQILIDVYTQLPIPLMGWITGK